MVVDETFQVYSGPSIIDGDVVFYGTLDGWFKWLVQGSGRRDRKRAIQVSRAFGHSIGNPMTYKHKGTQYVAVLSGVGGWAAIGLAASLTKAVPLATRSVLSFRTRCLDPFSILWRTGPARIR